MAKMPAGFEEHISDMGLPPEAGKVMRTAIRRAGYDPDRESEQFMGLAALTSALRIHDAATRVVARARGRVGRNDPCPCGSGRKYKKCCQGKGQEVTDAAPAGPPFPLDEPDLIPRLHRTERFAEDMDALYRLFREDSGLRRVRFDGGEVVGFVAEVMEDEPEKEPTAEADAEAEPDKDGPDPLEQWVARYLQEVEGEEALGNLEAALIAAAPRRVQSVPDLRALAAGLALAGMPADEGEAGEVAANPLHTLVFRCTLQEAVESQEVIEELVAQASGTAGTEEETADRSGQEEES